MTQDLQTLERQLWSSMPQAVKAMLDSLHDSEDKTLDELLAACR